MNDNFIIEYFNDKSWRSLRWVKEDIKNYLLTRYNDLYSSTIPQMLAESLYRLRNNINVLPLCPYCNKPRKWGTLDKGYYSTCCNPSCVGKQSLKTFQKHHDGLVNPWQLESTKQKIKETMIERYGVENPSQSKEICEKRRNTMIERFGVENAAENPKIKEKIKNIMLEKYGETSPLKVQSIRDKGANTMMERYGVPVYSKSDKFKEQYKIWLDSLTIEERKEIRDKAKNTMIERYGVDNVMDIPGVKEKFNWDEMIKHRNETYKKQKEMGIVKPKSKAENKTYNKIIKYFPDAIQQYFDKRYSYNGTEFECDIYIPSIDLFIECQYHPVHGGHPYNPDDPNEIDTIKFIENHPIVKAHDPKNKTYQFLVRDPLKRKVAKDNNLNFIEFWNIHDVDDWLLTFENIT